MKAIFIMFAVLIVRSQGYLMSVENIPPYFLPVINVRGIQQSMVYIKSKVEHEILIGSLLWRLYTDQSIVLANGDDYPGPKKGVLNRDSNIVIVTETLSVHDLDSIGIRKLSYWCPVYIILTSKNNTLCENDYLSKSFYEEARRFMNNLWHTYRIIRVIIALPYTCPNHFIMYGGKKPSNVSLYDRTIKLVQAKNIKQFYNLLIDYPKIHDLTEGYPLKANIFYRFPTSIKQCSNISYFKKINFNYSNGFCGIDGMVMHDFMEHHQYKLSVPDDERCNRYGYLQPYDQNATGSLGCIIRKQMDISFNSRFMVQYSTTHYLNLHYVTLDSLCVVLKRPEIIDLWRYPYIMYGARSGIILALLVFILGILSWASAWITRDITGRKPQTLLTYITNSISSTVFGYQIGKRNETYRPLIGTSLFCSIIILAFYQGIVNYQFTTRSRFSEVKSLQELYHTKTILHTTPQIQSILTVTTLPNDTAQKNYLEKTQLKNSSIGMGYMLDHPHIASISRGNDIRVEILLNFTDAHGSPMMYVIDECFHTYYLSHIARTGFLFLEPSLLFMMRLVEAGLPDKYYEWTRRTLKLGSEDTPSGSEPRAPQKIKLKHLRIAFGILTFGYLVSTCAFVVEKYRRTR